MNKHICRLCLQSISDNYQEIGQISKNLLKLNLGISKENVTCAECTNNLQVFFNLKSACVDVRKNASSLTDLKNNISLDTVKIESTYDLEPVSEQKNEIRCSFCTKPTGSESLVSLHESKEDIFLIDVLEKYIPELNSSNIGELLTCETCHVNMQSVSNFLKKCLDVEEKISKYAETEGTDDGGQIELQDVQQFIFNPILKFEGESCLINDHIREGLAIKVSKIACDVEGDHVEPIIKTEEIDIKTEQDDCDSFEEHSTEVQLYNEHKNFFDITMYKCDTCTYVTTLKNRLYDHISTHKKSSERKIFKCEICAFETQCEQYLNRHKLMHKSPHDTLFQRGSFTNDTKWKHKNPSREKMHKCDICTYDASSKSRLNEQKLIRESPYEALCKRGSFTYETKLIHKSPLETIMYKCDACTYEAKSKFRLNKHKLVHKRPSEITMFKCDMCTFEAKRKSDLKRHLLTHKNPSEMTKMKCEICAHETIHKSGLKKHMLIHKDISEVTLYKCEICTYETLYKGNLTDHELIHKSPSEITMFKCEICTFQAKRKRVLKTHMLRHKRDAEVTRFKCEECAFETIHTQVLKRHMLIHKGLSEVPTYKCEYCAFQTIHKGSLPEHQLIHKSPSEITMFKCKICPFEAKRKSALRGHMLIHKNPSEVTIFHCESCTFRTTRKCNLTRHKLIHKGP